MAKKSAKRSQKMHGENEQKDKDPSAGAKVESTKKKAARAPDAPGKRTAASSETEAAQTVDTDVVEDYLLAVTSANLQALRNHVQAGAGIGEEGGGGKAKLSKERNALIAALEKLGAAYSEMLQR